MNSKSVKLDDDGAALLNQVKGKLLLRKDNKQKITDNSAVKEALKAFLKGG